LLRLGLVISVLGTGLARADFIFIGYNGVTPYSLDETRVSFPPSPVVVDRIRPDAPRLGSGETIVDSGAGQIKTTYITAPPRDALGNTFAVGPWVVNAQLDDTAHFIGTGDVTIKFETLGFGVLPQTDFNNDLEYDTVLTRLLVGNRTLNATAQFANMPLQGYTVPIANVPFLIDLVVEDTFRVSGTLAKPDSLSFDFLLAASGVGGASLNLSDTAQLSFVLPPGVDVNTDGGFSQSGSAVPEPSSLVLLGTGFACLLGYSRRRKKQSA
jgi:hypothetical protein